MDKNQSEQAKLSPEDIAAKIKQVEELCALYPNEAYIFHYELGQEFSEYRLYHDAIAQFEKAIELKEDYAIAYQSLGIALTELGQHEAAAEQFERAVYHDPDTAYVNYRNWGLALAKLGHTEHAIEKYKQSLKLSRGYSTAYNSLGLVYKELKRYEEASKQFEYATYYASPNRMNDPRLYVYYYNWGELFAAWNQHDKAVEKYLEAVEHKRDYAKAYNSCGISLDKLGRHRDAIDCFQEALKYDLDSAYIYNTNVGLMLAQLAMYEEAIEHYKKAIDDNKTYTDAYTSLALAFEKLGKVEDASKCFEQAAKHNIVTPIVKTKNEGK